jgi:plastocyanin
MRSTIGAHEDDPERSTSKGVDCFEEPAMTRLHRIVPIVALAASVLGAGGAIIAVTSSDDEATVSSTQLDAKPTEGSAVGSASGTEVPIKGFAFLPESITVAAGATVEWTNKDSFAHSIKSADGSFDSPDLAEGQAFSHAFATPGTYSYICGIHNSMTGTVIVNA